MEFRTFAAGLAAGVILTLGISATGQQRPALPVEQLRKLADVISTTKAHYAGEIEDTALIDGCIAGLARKLDAQSDYLDREEFRRLQVGSGARGAVGFEIMRFGDRVKVVSPIEGTPADRAGVQPNDVILKIDDADTSGLSLQEAVKLLGGAPGTQVKVSLMRAGTAAPAEYVMTRELIRVQSVRSRLLGGGIGYLRVSQFQEPTLELLAKALDALRAENGAALKGLVLDLRNNPGGLLTTGVGVAALFLPDNALVVSMEGRSAENRKRFNADPRDYRPTAADPRARLSRDLREVPLVVLVNGASAAASEIVAGALQDHKRATVAGEKTFGRGSIQTIYPLADNTAFKLTTAYWKTPNGRTIQGEGVTPDVALGAGAKLDSLAAYGGPSDAGLQRAVELLRR
jgi:carboxyl-terminal processing protease